MKRMLELTDIKGKVVCLNLDSIYAYSYFKDFNPDGSTNVSVTFKVDIVDAKENMLMYNDIETIDLI